jgi:ABC-type polysaccharide/polyol phosphate export permease
MFVKIHFSWKDRNVLSILLLNQNLVVSLCRSFSFQCKMLMVEIKDVYFVISIETGPLFWFSPWFFGSVYFS